MVVFYPRYSQEVREEKDCQGDTQRHCKGGLWKLKNIKRKRQYIKEERWRELQ